MEPIKEDSDKIIINLLQKCQLEAENQTPIPFENVESKVLHYSGISLNQLEVIIGRHRATECTQTHCINFHINVTILNSLLHFYKLKMQPTCRHIYEYAITLQPALQHVNYNQFIHELNMIGINYQTTFGGKMLLMEDPKITFERSLFLKKMTRFRQLNVPIYYVSERIIDNNFNFDKLWVPNCKTSKMDTKEHVFFHAISKNGFKNGLFCYSPTEYDFYKWIVDILVPSFSTKSAIVFDNSPLHGTPKLDKISMFGTKDEMRTWLRENNIPHSNLMKKWELYRLIENSPKSMNKLAPVDSVIKANGHEVLRLPTHSEDLTPIDQIWQDIKTFQSLLQDDLHNNILKYFLELPPATYALFSSGIKKKEETLADLDEKMDQALDQFLKDLKCSEFLEK